MEKEGGDLGVCFSRMPYLFPTRRLNPEPVLLRRCKALVTLVLAMLGTPLPSTHLAAQWLKVPTAGVPRKADGKVDMSAPSPRLQDGKPDFSGVWMTAEPNMPPPGGLSSPKEAASPRQPPSDSPGDQPELDLPADSYHR